MKIANKWVCSITCLMLMMISCGISVSEKSRNTDSHAEKSSLDESQIYPSFPNNTVTVLGSNVLSIFQDSRDHYWFGTQSMGAFRYDGKQLIQFTVKDGLSDNQIQTIQEDAAGIIWFGTGGFGISKFDGQTITRVVDSDNASDSSILPSSWSTGENDLWFHANDGAYRYDGNSLFHHAFNSSNTVVSNFTGSSLRPESVYCILKDSKGTVWFGTQSNGVGYYNSSEDKSAENPIHWLNEKGLSGPALLALFEDHTGAMWFGNNGTGLYRYDGKTLTNFTAEHNLSNDAFRESGKAGPGTLARIYTVNEDKSGDLWIGTVDAGVWRFDGVKLTNYTTQNGLISNAVTIIYKDRKGELWFGTAGSGVCKFDGTKFSKFLLSTN
ncbi:MAG: two-component regulator propeller domain-containing protein [Flavobacteriales bacterium]